MTWHPIESAPLNIFILLYGEPYGKNDEAEGLSIQIGKLTTSKVEWWEQTDNKTQKLLTREERSCSAWLRPTHWASLLSAPGEDA